MSNANSLAAAVGYAVTTTDIRAELRRAIDELPRGLRAHILRVVDEARRLATGHRVDPERAEIAALGHDLVRGRTPPELLAMAPEHGIEPSDVERAEPVLLHGPISARIMADQYGIDDEDALAAARWHTTARAGMSALERLIFVADKIELQKARSDQDIARARSLADGSLDKAMRVLLDRQVRRAVEKGWPLHPDTVAARNELIGADGTRA
jgi:predicted HD superfamily hydrolase involved in NAD metabolism